MTVLAVDLGGTHLRTALLRTPDKLLTHHSIRWPDLGNPLPLMTFVAYLRSQIENSLIPASEIEAVGISIAAVVDHAQGCVKIGENVGWQNVPLKKILEKELGLPTQVDTDAFCGGLAEARLGSGVGLEHFFYIVIGSGIGHALVMGGKVWHGLHGAANVFGHIKVLQPGQPCYCGGSGCVCQYAAGKGLARLGQLRSGGTTSAVTGEKVIRAYRRTTKWAREVVAEAHQQLAFSLSAAFNLLDLETTILGGGAVSDVFPDLEQLQSRLEELVYPEIRPIVLRKSRLGAEAMLLGAGLLALDAPK